MVNIRHIIVCNQGHVRDKSIGIIHLIKRAS